MASAYALPGVQTAGVEVGRQNSLLGRECSSNFPWQEIARQRCIRQPAFFWREIISVKSNGIKIKEQKRAPEKRRRNFRNLREERLERCRGRRKRGHFNEGHRKAERNRAIERTLICKSWLSDNVFLLNAFLAASHIL